MNYYQFDIEVAPLIIGREALIAELAEIGFESFSNSASGFAAYIPKLSYQKKQFDEVTSKYESMFQIQVGQKEIPSENWNKKWESEFQPVLVADKCLIRAPFHPKTNAEIELIIQPQMSFGTGHHHTTELMVIRMLETKFKGKSVLDLGCGTGVLAILAIKLHADLVDALDIDQICVENTKENALLNLAVNINVNNGSWDQISIKDYDYILANINKNVIFKALPAIVKGLNEGGKLLCSGFFEDDINEIIEQARLEGLELIHQEILDSWALLEFWKTKNNKSVIS